MTSTISDLHISWAAWHAAREDELRAPHGWLSLTALHPWNTRTAVITSSDEKLFSDLASIEQSNEPRAIRPIHNLFQE